MGLRNPPYADIQSLTVHITQTSGYQLQYYDWDPDRDHPERRNFISLVVGFVQALPTFVHIYASRYKIRCPNNLVNEPPKVLAPQGGPTLN